MYCSRVMKSRRQRRSRLGWSGVGELGLCTARNVSASHLCGNAFYSRKFCSEGWTGHSVTQPGKLDSDMDPPETLASTIHSPSSHNSENKPNLDRLRTELRTSARKFHKVSFSFPCLPWLQQRDQNNELSGRGRGKL